MPFEPASGRSISTAEKCRSVPIGEIGGGRERPPFLPPGSGAGALRNSHLRNTPWGSVDSLDGVPDF